MTQPPAPIDMRGRYAMLFGIASVVSAAHGWMAWENGESVVPVVIAYIFILAMLGALAWWLSRPRQAEIARTQGRRALIPGWLFGVVVLAGILRVIAAMLGAQ